MCWEPKELLQTMSVVSSDWRVSCGLETWKRLHGSVGMRWALAGWLQRARWNKWEARFLLGNGFHTGLVVEMEQLAEHQQSKYPSVLRPWTPSQPGQVKTLALTLGNLINNICQVLTYFLKCKIEILVPDSQDSCKCQRKGETAYRIINIQVTLSYYYFITEEESALFLQ